MKDPNKRLIVRSGVIAILLGVVPACTVDDGESVDDQDNLDMLAALEDPSHEEFDYLAELGISGAQEQAPGPNNLVPDKVAQITPSPDDVYIEDIVASGVGCPLPGSAVAQISSDKKSFILIFKDMLLTNPPPPPIKTTNCVASVKLHVPSGWQVSVATVNTRGYAFLEKKIKARQTSNYFFAGQPVGFSAHSDLVGPFDDFYVFSDEVPFQSLVWSPCGTSSIFAINTSLQLNAIANPTGNGIFNNTSIDGQFKKIFHWQWKKC
ncbi:putative secreted protein [Enhygromyxa salina]|uniref:Putative secreted protein n=1 Tax=Enhygromyxa salina TaxID=215803 RepID=A0A0C1ZLU0_9BACT|nr:DUF4360 domain-containing protein [Enhygromyxa salina]KIG11753.1 putative secreted protein [Enhygromyxa salina]